MAWTEGNLVRPLVHGAEYFRCLLDDLAGARRGRPRAVHRLAGRRRRAARRRGRAASSATVLVDLVERGVDVRGLVWRSHPHQAHLSEQEAIHLAEVVNEAGGEVLLDERVRRAGSHHQKLVLVRHPGAGVRRRRLRRRHRPLPRPPRRRAPPRRPAGHRHRSDATATGRRGTTCSSRSGVRRSATCPARSASGGTTRRRSTIATRGGPASPGWRTSPARPSRCRPCRPIPEAGGPARRAGAAHVSAQAPGVPVRRRGRAQHRPGLRQGVPAGPAG